MKTLKIEGAGSLLLLLIIIGCARSETKSSDKLLFVRLDPSYELTIIEGKIEKISETEEEKILSVHFFSVRGGATHFLGLKFNETNGDTYKRLYVYNKDKLNTKLSLNEILKLTPEVIDSTEVYPLFWPTDE